MQNNVPVSIKTFIIETDLMNEKEVRLSLKEHIALFDELETVVINDRKYPFTRNRELAVKISKILNAQIVVNRVRTRLGIPYNFFSLEKYFNFKDDEKNCYLFCLNDKRLYSFEEFKEKPIKKENKEKRIGIRVDSRLHEIYIKNSKYFNKKIKELLENNKDFQK